MRNARRPSKADTLATDAVRRQSVSLATAQYVELSGWIDAQLIVLEARWAHFSTTPDSQRARPRQPR